MLYLIVAYLGIALWVFYMKYCETPVERRQKVKDHWLQYYVRCLGWPMMLVSRSKGL